MNMYLNIRDTTDPLNITLGNLNLKNAYEHTVRSSLSRMYPKRQMLMVAEAEYSVSTNEIAMGYTYDTKLVFVHSALIMLMEIGRGGLIWGL